MSRSPRTFFKRFLPALFFASALITSCASNDSSETPAASENTETSTLSASLLAELETALSARSSSRSSQVTLSDNATTAIVAAARLQLQNDNLTLSDNLTAVLCAIAEGALTGIGDSGLSDDLDDSTPSLSALNTVVSTLVENVDDYETFQGRLTTDNLTETAAELTSTSLDALEGTQLDVSHYDDAAGTIAAAIVAGLDDAGLVTEGTTTALETVMERAVLRFGAKQLDNDSAINAIYLARGVERMTQEAAAALENAGQDNVSAALQALQLGAVRGIEASGADNATRTKLIGASSKGTSAGAGRLPPGMRPDNATLAGSVVAGTLGALASTDNQTTDILTAVQSGIRGQVGSDVALTQLEENRDKLPPRPVKPPLGPPDNATASDNTTDTSTVVQTDIDLPTVTSVLINAQASSTSDRSVSITVEAIDLTSAVAQVFLTEEDLDSAEGQTFTDFTNGATIKFELSAEEGVKTVYVWVKDAAGNLSESSGSDSITYAAAASSAVAYSCADVRPTASATITDSSNGQSYSSSASITVNASDCTFTGNGVPNHDVGPFSANQPAFSAVSAEFDVSLSPTAAGNSSPLSLRTVDGVVNNGLPIDFFPNECYEKDFEGATNCANAEYMYNPGTADQSIVQRLGFDEGNGHPQPDGTYHYHGDPKKSYTAGTLDPVAYAADGYPIYGYYGTGQRATSGYTLKSGTRNGGGGGEYDGLYMSDFEWTNAGDLDECNGSSELTTDGSYAYYFTDDFPYVPYCFRGTIGESFYK